MFTGFPTEGVILQHKYMVWKHNNLKETGFPTEDVILQHKYMVWKHNNLKDTGEDVILQHNKYGTKTKGHYDAVTVS